ncbi:MAG: hypothetical protein DBY37_07615 [Desulfovibrionaceae bacterium]|nr:MAG: hypothetical protein DBY37_07615 [Desulfovibrionaceae bacterium]
MKVSLESFSVFEMLPKRFRATGGARLLSALSVRKALRAHGQGRRNCRNPPAAPGSGGGGLRSEIWFWLLEIFNHKTLWVEAGHSSWEAET